LTRDAAILVQSWEL